MTTEVFAVCRTDFAPTLTVLFSIHDQEVYFYDIFKLSSGCFDNAHHVSKCLIKLGYQIFTHQLPIICRSSLPCHKQLPAKTNRTVAEAFRWCKIGGI